MFNYAVMLEKGKGGLQNLKEARGWYRRATKNGDSEAMFNYADML